MVTSHQKFEIPAQNKNSKIFYISNTPKKIFYQHEHKD